MNNKKRHPWRIAFITGIALSVVACSDNDSLQTTPATSASGSTQDTVSYDPNEVYVYDSKGKQLQQIVVDSLYTFDFSYNKDKTVSKIVHVNEDGYTETIDFKWTNQLVDKMTYTIDGIVRLEYTFHRIDNKKDKAYSRIDYIEEMYDREFYDQYFWKSGKQHPLYDKVFGNFEEIAEVFRNSTSKDLMMYSVKRFTYDPGKHKKYENTRDESDIFLQFQNLRRRP